MTYTHYVEYKGDIVHIGSKKECRQFARNRNHEYQSDDFRVKSFEE